MSIVITPMYDYLVIKVKEPVKVTSGGILLGKVSPTYRGEVVGIGHTVKETKMGDDIQHNKFCGIDWEYGGVTYKFLREEDIMVFYQSPSNL